MSMVDKDYTLCRLLAAASNESNKVLDVRLSSPAWTELFRFLRNDAASSRQRQDEIAKGDLIDQVTKRVLCLADAPPCSADASQHQVSHELRCAIQFFGNLVTNNEANKRLIWPRVSACFLCLLSCDDPILVKYSTMLFYNCIVGLPSLRDEFLYSHSQTPAILSLILRSATDTDSEWGLFAMESCLQSPSFMERCYPSLPPDQRLFILDILISAMSVKEERYTSADRVPFANLECVAQAFQRRADVIFRTDLSVSPEEPLEVVRFAEVLCAASSSNLYNKELASLSSLLCCGLFLLKGIHMARKEASIDVESNFGTKSDEARSPIDGLKCSLVRLVANMCWRNRTNQDKVREFDGIPLLLDCCKLDAKNPYIIQWVVYAIRNLCEGNAENQLLIASMERRGLDFVRVLGNEAEEASPPACGRTATFQQRAADDIFDLFS